MAGLRRNAEWQFVWVVAAVVAVLGLLPLAYGWLVTPSGQEFTGVHFASYNDWFVYYSYLEQARQGNLLFFDLFAGEAHLATFNCFWLLIGLGAKLFQLNNVVAFTLARLTLTPVFFWVAYRFISLFVSEVRHRRLALLLVTFGGGLGILLIDRLVRFPSIFERGAFQWPMDLWVPEAFTFLTLYYSPHFIASLTLIVLTLDQTLRFALTNRWVNSVGAALAAHFLFSFHPFHVLSILSILGVFALSLMVQARKILWSQVRHLALVVVFALPPIVYYLNLIASDPLMRQKALQNINFTPPLWITLFSYGLLVVFAVLAIRTFVKKDRLTPAELLLLVWAITQFIVVYAPVAYQRRMSAGLQFSLALLATFGLVEFWEWARARSTRLAAQVWGQRYIVGSVLALLLGSSTLFALAVDVQVYTAGTAYAYLPRELTAAATWLRSTPKDSITFNSSDRKINVLPAYSGRLVYSGHGVETPNFLFRERQVEWFFERNREPATELSFLRARGINYVFYGPDERKLGSFDPTAKPYLREVFRNALVTIYQVL